MCMRGNLQHFRSWLTRCVWEETSNTSDLDSLNVYERKPSTLQVLTHSMCMRGNLQHFRSGLTRCWLTRSVWEETSNTSNPDSLDVDSLDVYERKPPTLQVWTHSMCMRGNLRHFKSGLTRCVWCVTNEEVHAKIQQAAGPHDDLLTTVKRRKLQWYGHVSHTSGLAKTILQGTVKGRRQGRQRKRWEDNIREWTGLEFGKSQRGVANLGKRRKLVVK